MNEGEMLAFVNHVLSEANRIVVLAGTGQADRARETAGGLLDEAGRVKRALLNVPEPDPTVDYDADSHWDGTPILAGETRREKGDPAPEGYDLTALNAPE